MAEKAKRQFVKCPGCDGSGDAHLKREWRKGVVGALADPQKPEECKLCKGDGVILRPDPPAVK